MNAIRRINPRRPYTLTAEGLRRIVLGQSAAAGDDASTPAQTGDASAAKPLRSQAPAVRRMLAVAHSERGALSAGARQARRSATLERMADPGASARRPCARFALAALLAEIAGDPPLHIFMSDEDPDDADLGRRLAHTGYAAATGVALNAGEALRMVARRLARCPCHASCCR